VYSSESHAPKINPVSAWWMSGNHWSPLFPMPSFLLLINKTNKNMDSLS
jgi:hypothetical protein